MSTLNSEDDYEYLYKLVLVGDATVGKTHLLSRYMKGSLPKAPAATIGVEFATRTVQLASGSRVKAQIWDTAGQERYRAITTAHYRKAVGALLIYDVTRAESFKNCARWLQEVKEGAGPGTVILLVGNKVDLAESESSSRQVTFKEASDFARQAGLLFAETSAVTSHNVNYVFDTLLQEIYNQAPKKDRASENGYSAGGLHLSPPTRDTSCPDKPFCDC
mmetsp:Transcript_74510/g.177409  ORF Transcript_74510/g.177409 Transcript_74510/m.177409 type:complete len:219 (+) Transcript_74510:50-706(+)